MLAAEQPQIMVRQYTRSLDFHSEVARLAAHGWEVVSLLERRPPPTWLGILTLGFSSRIAPPDPERLVTFSRSFQPAGNEMRALATRPSLDVTGPLSLPPIRLQPQPA